MAASCVGQENGWWMMWKAKLLLGEDLVPEWAEIGVFSGTTFQVERNLFG